MADEPERAPEVGHADELWAGGFTAVPNALLADPSLSLGAKMVFVQLLRFSWQDGGCFPGQGGLAENMGVAVRSIRRYVGELEEAGLVRVDQRGLGQTNYYSIEVPRPAKLSGQDRPPVSGPEVSNLAGQDGSLLSGPSNEEDADEKDAVEEDAARARGNGHHQETIHLVDPGEPVREEPKKVNGKLTNVSERKLGWAVLTSFNGIFNTSYKAEDHVSKIIRRIREHPELHLEDHEALIRRNAKAPWWEGVPSPSVIYGNGAQFERSMSETGDRAPTTKHARRQAALEFARRLEAGELGQE